MSFSQERSLTTILYLMSLTEEARTPFSLVDEINQVSSFLPRRAMLSYLYPLVVLGNGPACRTRGARFDG